jgi:thiamine biosynthesis lipoprotein
LPPGRSGWEIALAGLDNAPAPGSPLTLSHAGVSTSGDAEQWVEIGGVRYSHILDPRTGMGLTGHSSVTVVAADATTSDMLATAVSVLGPAKGRQLVDAWGGASALIGERTPQGDRWTRSAQWH